MRRNITRKRSRHYQNYKMKRAAKVPPFFVLAASNCQLYYIGNTDGGDLMNNALFLLPLLMLGTCDVSAEKLTMETVGSSELKDGKAITAQATDPGRFTAISTVGPDDVIFKTGDSFSVSATGSVEALKNLRFVLDGDKLLVGRYKYSWKIGDSDTDKAAITITAPSISAISSAGSGNVNADLVTGNSVALSSAGSGKLDVADVETPTLKAEVAGSGSMTLAGKVSDADYGVAGSGSINALKLASSKAKASVAGSGDINLTASGSVVGEIAGSGNIHVTGGAKCTSSVVGPGKLNCP
jgi:hypothetical protein